MRSTYVYGPKPPWTVPYPGDNRVRDNRDRWHLCTRFYQDQCQDHSLSWVANDPWARISSYSEPESQRESERSRRWYDREKRRIAAIKAEVEAAGFDWFNYH